jgi:hypothetical protein
VKWKTSGRATADAKWIDEVSDVLASENHPFDPLEPFEILLKGRSGPRTSLVCLRNFMLREQFMSTPSSAGVSRASDPYGLKRLERSRAQTPEGCMRLCAKIMRECGLGEATRAQQRASRAEERKREKLKPEEVDHNAYRHPTVRTRTPRDMPKRRAPGWVAIHFVLPKRLVEGLTLLTKSMADREQAERSRELYGFRRRYPRTKNVLVAKAIDDLLLENGLGQFCLSSDKDLPR